MSTASARACRGCSNGSSARQPDVVCLQELKCADESLPIADIEAAGYGAVWHGQKGFNGVAILAKGDTPELRRVGLPGDPDDSHSRYIEAEVGGVVVASLYLPNGNPVGTEKFDYKLTWMERLRGACRGAAGAPSGRPCWPATGTSCPRTATSSRSGRRSMTR